MKLRFLGIWLAAVALTHGQEPEAPPITLDQLRETGKSLKDPNGELSRLAELMLGKKGGNHLFYFPTRDEPATPAKWGFKFENVAFKSTDGTALHGWFMPARGRIAKGTVVFSHGNAGAVGHHIGFTMWLVEAGYNVFMYDYRGFGKSAGSVDRRGMLDDVKAAFSYVASRADVDPARLISFGHSLGGAKSVTALAETPVKGLRAVVIDGAFASYQAMAKLIAGDVGQRLVTDEWAPKDYVGKLSPVPLLVVHGEADEVVPASQGKQLFEGASEPKTLFIVKNGSHGNALARDNGAYRKKMIVWLEELLTDG